MIVNKNVLIIGLALGFISKVKFTSSGSARAGKQAHDAPGSSGLWNTEIYMK